MGGVVVGLFVYPEGIFGSAGVRLLVTVMTLVQGSNFFSNFAVNAWVVILRWCYVFVFAIIIRVF